MKKTNTLLSRVIKENTQLPNRVFDEKFHIFFAVDPSIINDDFFFEGLLSFLDKKKQEKIAIADLVGKKNYLLDIKDLTHDYWINNLFSVDELSYTRTGITSDDTDWGLYYDSIDYEMVIIGFSDYETELLFVDAFDENWDYFMSISDFVLDMNAMLNFSNEAKDKYNSIIKNHISLIK